MGYNPNEKRDAHGMWTSGGVVGHSVHPDHPAVGNNGSAHHAVVKAEHNNPGVGKRLLYAYGKGNVSGLAGAAIGGALGASVGQHVAGAGGRIIGGAAGYSLGGIAGYGYGAYTGYKDASFLRKNARPRH
jgi:hypothetical protein